MDNLQISTETSLRSRSGSYAGDRAQTSKELISQPEAGSTSSSHVLPGFQDKSNGRNHGILRDNESENASLDTTFTESTVVPRRSLGFVQCSSLMINQMIGTGIFTTPGFVLLLVKSKQISLVLWAVGGIYSLLSVLLYLEFGTALPYNGGALIYLDETFHQPELYASVVFSFIWIVLSNTAGNCITFAEYVLTLAMPETPSSEFDDRLIRFLGIIVQTTVCLLLYFLRRFCFVANNFFAIFKVILSLVIFGAGIYAARQPHSGLDDFHEKQPGGNITSTLAAMVYILYSYQGWEHTNYIAGEIKAPKQTLRNAAFFSVSLVTVLYMLVSTAYYTSASYAEITGPSLDTGVAAHLAQTVFGSPTGMRACIAISAFSCLIANAYTTSKVKQAIAWQRFIPFHKFFSHQSKAFDSPGGALLLHWVFSCITIAIVNASSDAYAFNIGIFSYGYEVIMVFLGIGILRLGKRMTTISETGTWSPVYMKNKFILYAVSFLFTGMNILMMVMTALPKDPDTIPRFYWPVTVAACIAAGSIYWGGLKGLQMKFGGQESIGKWIGFEVQVYNEGDENIPEMMRNVMVDANLDGSRRRVSYKISGPTERFVTWCSKLFQSVKYYVE